MMCDGSLAVLPVILDEFRHNLLYRSYDDVVGNAVDGRIGIAIDGDDDARILHTGDVLNLTGDTACDVHLGMDGDTRLTNLTVVVEPTSIDGGTRSAYLAVEHLGQFEQLVEAFLRTDAITAGNDDGRTLEVVLGSLYVMVEHADDVGLGAHIF